MCAYYRTCIMMTIIKQNDMYILHASVLCRPRQYLEYAYKVPYAFLP